MYTGCISLLNRGTHQNATKPILYSFTLVSSNSKSWNGLNWNVLNRFTLVLEMPAFIPYMIWFAKTVVMIWSMYSKKPWFYGQLRQKTVTNTKHHQNWFSCRFRYRNFRFWTIISQSLSTGNLWKQQLISQILPGSSISILILKKKIHWLML